MNNSDSYTDVCIGHMNTLTFETSFGASAMDNKKEIVFFEDLGFGWLFDAGPIRRLREKESIEDVLIQRSLAELFRKGKLL